MESLQIFFLFAKDLFFEVRGWGKNFGKPEGGGWGLIFQNFFFFGVKRRGEWEKNVHERGADEGKSR